MQTINRQQEIIMIEIFLDMIQASLGIKYNSLIAVFLYWLPLGLSLMICIIDSYISYRQDLISRSIDHKNNTNDYKPRTTVGGIVGEVIMALIPGVNIWIALTRAVPKLFDVISKALNIPLVPKK